MYLLPFNHPEFPPKDDGWKFFIVCEDKDGNVSRFMDAMDAAGETFDLAWRHVSNLAQQGKPWKTLIPDAKRFHDVGKVKIRRKSGKTEQETVWSFKHARIRILWCYAGSARKVMLFGHTLWKDQNEIADADVELVGKELQRYFDELDAGTITIAGGDENEHTFGKLFAEREGKSHARQKGSSSRRRS